MEGKLPQSNALERKTKSSGNEHLLTHHVNSDFNKVNSSTKNAEIDSCRFGASLEGMPCTSPKCPSELLNWFKLDRHHTITPSCLLDVVMALTGSQFSFHSGIGAKMLDEFNSIGGVLSTDYDRLFSWLKKQGTPDDLAEQFSLRLKAASNLMHLALLEEIEERTIIATSKQLIEYLKITSGFDRIEQLRLIFLDKRSHLIRDEIRQIGTVNQIPLYPREIAKRSLELDASAVIMVHNHPAGSLWPSNSDIKMTNRVKVALSSISVLLHDHIIIAQNAFFSFEAEGLL